VKKVIGCDVAKTFVILHDGKNHFYIDDSTLDLAKEIVKNSIVVLEQTGAYGIRWAYIFSDFGAKVFIADGKEFKAFRHGQTRKKTDWIDAFYLRKFFLKKSKRKYCKPFNPVMHSLRALIRQHIRNDKDITRHTNRLLQYLAVIFPYKEYYRLNKKQLIKRLDEIENDLKLSPHHLSTLALMELKKLKTSVEEQERLEKEIKTIAQNHPDYEILKTFPSFGDILIATLIAYYWDVRNFSDVDAFIGYVLMGANFQQSGKTVWEIKTDKARTEVKGKFFNLFKASHIKNRRGYTHPYYPLTENVKQLAGGGHNLKKRYIKFLSRILELVYYAIKYRKTYKEILEWKLKELERNLIRLKNYPQLNKVKAYELHRLVENLETYKEMFKLVSECKDISDSQKREAECQVYFRDNQKPKEGKNENPNQNRNITGDNRKPKSQIPEPDPENDPGHNNDVPPYLKRKGFEPRSNPPPETLRDIYPQTQENQEDEISY